LSVDAVQASDLLGAEAVAVIACSCCVVCAAAGAEFIRSASDPVAAPIAGKAKPMGAPGSAASLRAGCAARPSRVAHGRGGPKEETLGPAAPAAGKGQPFASKVPLKYHAQWRPKCLGRHHHHCGTHAQPTHTSGGPEGDTTVAFATVLTMLPMAGASKTTGARPWDAED
jgi:hypothetical protein